MKHQERGYGGRLKRLLAMLSIAMFIASCGQNNNSGGNRNNGGGVVAPVPGVPVIGVGTDILPNNYMQIIRAENMCINGGARRVAIIPLQGMQLNAGGHYVGVSSFGDIAVINGNNGQATMTVEVCDRPGSTGQGQLLGNPIVNISQECPVGEISAANMVLVGQFQEQISFRPIFVRDPYTSQVLANSQVCNTGLIGGVFP